jgi:predicted flap endonuclease-1-like 5' DNA nuclease
MAERFTADLLFIVIVLLIAALLGFLIGYFLRKSMKCKKCTELEEENASLKLSVKKMEEEIPLLRERVLKLDEERSALRSKIEKLESEARSVADRGPGKKGVVTAARIAKDDLKVVLGIGPKISGILNKRGITTWKELSETSPATISDYLLQDGGEKYRMHDPSTWPQQAKLAHEGKWDELNALKARPVT